VNSIMIVEDEKDIHDLVKYHLRQAGFSVSSDFTGASVLDHARKDRPSLIILDLMLPDLDGKDICRALKSDSATRSVPVLMLTARAEEMDRIVGFELGADDYVTKPFSPRELVLRVKSLLRKREPDREGAKVIQFGDLLVDIERHQVWVKKEPVQLTSVEFKLLVALASSKGRVKTREALLNQVWGYTYEGYARTVDTHILRLREKLGSAREYIETLRGVGYRFREEVENEPLSAISPE
jgi:two-component system phosphate regulon response regulator PhoB